MGEEPASTRKACMIIAQQLWTVKWFGAWAAGRGQGGWVEENALLPREGVGQQGASRKLASVR